MKKMDCYVIEEKEKLNEYEALERITHILKKRIKTTQDIENLDAHFKDVKFFSDSKSKIDEESFGKLLKCLQYERIKGHEILFRRGDKGDKFYIILKGSVSVMIPKLDHEVKKRDNKEKLKAAKLFNESSKVVYQQIQNTSKFL